MNLEYNINNIYIHNNINELVISSNHSASENYLNRIKFCILICEKNCVHKPNLNLAVERNSQAKDITLFTISGK